MNSRDLVMKMLKWESLQKEIAKLEQEIELAVLEIKETQTIGNVRATYNNARKVYGSWEDAAKLAFEEEDFENVIDVNTEIYEEIDWKKLASNFESLPGYDDLLKANTSTTGIVNWQAVAKHYGKERTSTVPKENKPKVTLKLLEDK